MQKLQTIAILALCACLIQVHSLWPSNSPAANAETSQEHNYLQWLTDNLQSFGPSITLDNFMYLVFSPFHIGYQTGRPLVKQAFMAAMNLKEPSLELRKFAEEALHSCGITDDIIILEDPTLYSSTAAYVWQLGPYRFLVLRSDILQSQQRLFVVYHECGHLYYHHASQSHPIFLAAFMPTLIVHVGTKIFIARWEVSSRNEHIITSLLTTAIAYVIKTYGLTTWTKELEKEADLFACDMLLKIGRIDVVIDEIGTWRLPSTKHYSSEEKARYLTECLLKIHSPQLKELVDRMLSEKNAHKEASYANVP